MYITRVPNRGSPPAVLLRESYREGGKVKNRTLANLSSWPEAKIETLSRALKGLPPAGLDTMVEVTRSLPHGHVAAVLGTIRSLGVEELIGPAGSRQRDLVVAMITAAVIDGSSKLATARGLRAETAASSLGRLLGLEACDEDDLYAAMDCCCPGSAPSRTRWPSGTCATARWCCMTCHRPRSRAARARWARSTTPATGCAAGCRSSTGC